MKIVLFIWVFLFSISVSLFGFKGDTISNSNEIIPLAKIRLTDCIKKSQSPKCYFLPIVNAAVKRGWNPPSYYEVIEGKGFHE